MHNSSIHTINQYGVGSYFKTFLLAKAVQVMPCANCCIFGCMTSQSHSGISIFSLPKEDNLSKKMCGEWVNVNSKSQVIEVDLRHQIHKGKLHVWEKHFEGKFIEKCKHHYDII